MERPRLPDTPFWVESDAVGPDHLKLSPEESHHLLHVFRAGPGTPFQATDGRGGFYECVLEGVERRSARGRILERRRDQGELSRPIEALVGLPDWAAAEQVVEHAVPLGVTAIHLVPCERSGRGTPSAQRLTRLDRIARAALKQSRRSRLPSIGVPPSLGTAIAGLANGTRLLADPAGGGLPKSPQVSVQIAVGPPGGFTDAERRLLLDAEFSPISLGPSRLTTQTAALALIALARNLL